MEQIPDAPWIRDAEQNGMPGPEPDEVICPVCGKACESIYTERLGYDAIGCEHCIRERDAWDWYDWQSENNKEEH